ncbi:MAG: hypothetical protein WC244_00190 [Patescibacteria group bacterium]
MIKIINKSSLLGVLLFLANLVKNGIDRYLAMCYDIGRVKFVVYLGAQTRGRAQQQGEMEGEKIMIELLTRPKTMGASLKPVHVERVRGEWVIQRGGLFDAQWRTVYADPSERRKWTESINQAKVFPTKELAEQEIREDNL